MRVFGFCEMEYWLGKTQATLHASLSTLTGGCSESEVIRIYQRPIFICRRRFVLESEYKLVSLV